MAKSVVYVSFANNVIPYLHDLLTEKFDVEYWPHEEDITREELVDALKGKFALITGALTHIQIDGDLVRRSGGDLRVVAYVSAGMEYVNVEELKSMGVKVGTAARAHTEATAEQAVTLLLTMARNIFGFTSAYKSSEEPYRLTMYREYQQGLENSVVGVVGAGFIGTSVAKKVKSFNISRLLYSSRSEKAELQNLGGERKSIEDIMKESDFIVICLALNEETKGIISRRMIGLMKPNSVIVNVARGGLIDQDALVEALQNKKIRGAGLDVVTPEPLPFSHPLFKLDNAIVAPHVGYATYECMRKVAKYTVDNIVAVLEGFPMPWPA